LYALEKRDLGRRVWSARDASCSSGLDSLILLTSSIVSTLLILAVRDELEELEEDDATSVSLPLCVS
jgi:hypothetical protein